MCHTTKKAQSTKRRIEKCANQENRERPEQRRTGPDRNHGRDPGPEPNRPREGGGQGDPARVRPHPWRRQTEPIFLRRLHASMHRTVSPTTKFRCDEPS